MRRTIFDATTGSRKRLSGGSRRSDLEPIRFKIWKNVKSVLIGELLEDTALVKQGTLERQSRLELELNEERAGALRRISQTLESLIEQLHALRAGIAEAVSSDLPRDIARYRELRERAVLYRWYLDVQRESLGLRSDELIDEFYAVPPPLQS